MRLGLFPWSRLRNHFQTAGESYRFVDTRCNVQEDSSHFNVNIPIQGLRDSIVIITRPDKKEFIFSKVVGMATQVDEGNQ